MRAAVVSEYGPPDVVRVADVPDPVPRAGEVLVRVVATTVNSGDARIRGARFPRGFGPLARLAIGLRGPRRPVLGVVFSGVVEAVGVGAAFTVGDEVCGMTGAKLGAHAELVRAAKVVRKPAEVSHDDAAGVLFGGTTALHLLRDVRRGQSVLVVGASGAVGTNAVQLAAHAGATVTAVCGAANAELVRGLGAAHLVDHRRTPLAEITDRFDVVLDTVGTLDPATGRRLLTDDGVLVLAVASLGETVLPRRRVRAGVTPERPADFALLLERVAKGELRVVVDEVVGFDGIVAAHRRVDSGRKVGNLVLRP
ncbi:NAD(P)-dependent alcohol dehydrogenase [Pseudonocardia abyssalis]|uniref:NAD(P)-dependent alcohol dehydrogenase n=1 Tax=Pseudonocardia abyssalis TaxID=2792008 RepID=A0ABS6ULY5_9PSEU|nr:NAD(P)-dependent alcohol dehydrogenase [Pseudonocardia abyssalis]MBW0117868.1 NAD(P)-dependent alcohol dehydrogenase [Pseudonocardia abyssalis]MBW0132941.1 NAD(P)-dependent alcohol dehydrogenase [Pseudonocardia abyssalis]